MIECSDKNIWYKKRKKRLSKKLLSLLILTLIVFALFYYYKNVIVLRISEHCKEYVNSYSAESINNALVESLKDNINYSDLISIVKNEQGEITLISANSLKINSLSQKIIKETKENLDLRLEKGIPVPVLAFIGLPIVSGYGRQVMFNTMHVASVNCEFDSKFTSVGINQKIHSIYVMKGTALEDLYYRGEYVPPTEEEYVRRAAYMIANTKRSVVIHRLTGDCPKDMLVAPEWNSNKTVLIEKIRKYMQERSMSQGSML